MSDAAQSALYSAFSPLIRHLLLVHRDEERIDGIGL